MSHNGTKQKGTKHAYPARRKNALRQRLDPREHENFTGDWPEPIRLRLSRNDVFASRYVGTEQSAIGLEPE